MRRSDRGLERGRHVARAALERGERTIPARDVHEQRVTGARRALRRAVVARDGGVEIPLYVQLDGPGRVEVGGEVVVAVSREERARALGRGGSILEVLRRLLVASGVVAPERALHAVLGRQPTPARLHEQLATHLFARRYAYERRGVASIAREHRARSGVHRAESEAPELLLAWSA